MSDSYDVFGNREGLLYTYSMALVPRRLPSGTSIPSNVPSIIPHDQRPTRTRLSLKAKLPLPPHFHVVLVDDDHTSADFVFEQLRTHFHKSTQEAATLVRQIHNSGRAIAGTYPLQIAEHKADLVIRDAHQQGFPFAPMLKKV